MILSDVDVTELRDPSALYTDTIDVIDPPELLPLVHLGGRRHSVETRDALVVISKIIPVEVRVVTRANQHIVVRAAGNLKTG